MFVFENRAIVGEGSLREMGEAGAVSRSDVERKKGGTGKTIGVDI